MTLTTKQDIFSSQNANAWEKLLNKKVDSCVDFYCQTLEQARSLAHQLASISPNPKNVTIGLTELIINAIEHGNLGISAEEKQQYQSKHAWLEEIEHRLSLTRNKSKVVNIEVKWTTCALYYIITDEGEGFDWTYYFTEPNRTENQRYHGRGILLAKALCFDQLIYNQVGNTVTGIVYFRCIEK